MTDKAGPAIGLSIGATNLAAAAHGHAVTRRAVLTLFRHRPPEVGLPSENPRLDEPGLVLTDFAERVGDPVGIVAPDGSIHRGEVLLAKALRALAYSVADGHPIDHAPTITHPAHWSSSTVDALRRELAQVPEFADGVQLISDTKAALAALHADPGIPLRGVIAVCDFGASGTNVTLVDATRLTPIGDTVRHTDFSGDLVDQALLTRVVADLAAAGTLDVSSTSAIGSLGRLRSAARGAKERLSAVTVTGLAVELPGHSAQVRLTRAELDDAIAEPLAVFLEVVQDTLYRNRIHPADLVAVASTGGACSVPAITTALSEHLRVPVITPRQRPALLAAVGASLWASREPEDDNSTAMAPAAHEATGMFADADAGSRPSEALAWSENQSVPDVAPSPDYDYRSDFGNVDGGNNEAPHDDSAPVGLTGARPRMQFADDRKAAAAAVAPKRWYHNPARVAVAAVIVLLAAGAGIAVAMGDYTSAETPTADVTTTTPTTPTTVVAEPVPAPAQENPQAPAPVTQTVIQQQVATQAPAPATAAPVPEQSAPAPVEPAPASPAPTVTETTTTQETVTSTVPAPSAPAPEPEQQQNDTPQIPEIPAIPQIPQIPFIPDGG